MRWLLVLLTACYTSSASPPAARRHVAKQPPIDHDGDGLANAADQCPEEPEDKDTFQDEDGCPDPDNDKDGGLDADDKCPMEPEVYGSRQRYLDGCPD